MTRPSIAPFLLLGLLAACGDGGEPTGPTVDETLGTWRATRIEYTAVSGGATRELVALGATGQLVLDANGTGTWSYTLPAGVPVSAPFTWERDGGLMSWIYGPGNDDNWRVTLTAGTLRFELNGATKSYDCDGDGTPEPARYTLEFRR